MSYEDRLRQASWRGVSFEALSMTLTIGRHVVTHEFPLRDQPFAEDLARKARGLSVEGQITGPGDYDLERDRIVAEFQRQGPGALVLPTVGRTVWQLVDGSIDETFVKEQGQVRFSLQLVEPGSRSLPAVTQAPATTVANAAQASRDGTKAVFLRSFGVDDVASWVEDRAAGYVAAGLERIDAARVDDVWTIEEETEIRGALESVVASVFRAIVPEEVVDAVQEYVALLARWRTYGAIVRAFEVDPTVAQLDSRSWNQDVANTLAVDRLYRRTALASMSEALTTDYEPVTRDDSEAARDLLVGYHDRELAEVDVNADPEAFAATYASRLAVIRWADEVALDLVPLREYTPPGDVPAVVLAHRLYGDASRAREIVERNGVEHPLFVPGGRPIKVLAS